ncbi:uncharacterized protein LOC128392742 [Panonychus citri]|uniref:uncharacterized protein LOC128392742 n=1 Tax=Panonychus citri TaxID=50023 RepID=UPI0023077DE2|nr:uncharacterized protein LOC128392742 [Panonychus citri]
MNSASGNQPELKRLKDLRLSNKNKFKILMNYFESQHDKNMNTELVQAELTAYPIIKFFQLMMKDHTWLKEIPKEKLLEINKFIDRLIHINNQVTNEMEKEDNQIEIQNLSNNQIKNLLSIQVNKRQDIPKTWYDVTHIKILYTIIVKIPGLKNEREKKIGEITTELTEKLLEETSEDSGSAEEVIPGFDSAKVRCSSTSERIKVFNFLKKSKPQWLIQIPPIQDPQVKLSAVRFDEENINLWLERLFIKNRWKRCWKACIKHFYKVGKLYDVILEVDPALREWIEQRNGFVSAGYKRISVVDHFDIKQCRNCTRFGHLANRCSQISLCPYCGGVNHFHESCEIKDLPHKWKCPNCLKNGENAWEIKCAKFQERLLHELEKKNYQYKLIMA